MPQKIPKIIKEIPTCDHSKSEEHGKLPTFIFGIFAMGVLLLSGHTLMAALVNLTAAYILGKLIGLPGILLAVPIARVTTYFWYEPKLLFKQYFNQNVFTYYSSIARNLLITIVVGGLTTLLFSRF